MARRDWWPGIQSDQYQLMANFRDKIVGAGALLGLTPAQATAMQTLAVDFLFVYDAYTAASATSQAMTQWRDEVFYGTPEGDPVTPAPVFPVVGPVSATRGLVTQFFGVRDQILSMPAYTDVIGEDLGLVGSVVAPPDLLTFKPTIQVFPSQTGYLYTVVVGNRGASDQWHVEYRPKGGQWASAGTFTGKSADIVFTPAQSGDPFALEVRTQLKKKNENYGQLSDIVAVTVNP